MIAASSKSPISPAEAAANHRFWFAVYVGWIVIAALVSVFLTCKLWQAGNQEQTSAVDNALLKFSEQRTIDRNRAHEILSAIGDTPVLINVEYVGTAEAATLAND